MDIHDPRDVAAKAKIAANNNGSSASAAMSRARAEIVDHFFRIIARDMVFCVLILVFMMLAATVFGGLMSYLINRLAALPAVQLAIDSYEGLAQTESNTNTNTRALSPEFNLTMYGEKGPALHGVNKTLCYSRGSVKIRYQGIQLASRDIAGTCLDARNGHTITVFAQGRHVQVPLQLQNRLRDEARNGTTVLDLTVVLLVACDAAFPYCGRCSFVCQPLIGQHRGLFSRCHITSVQRDSNSLG